MFVAAYAIPDLRGAEETMEILRFGECAGERVATLSGGTVMHDPQVLLLDEPYQGFDWETYLRFWDLVTAFRDTGRSVLVVSHLAHDTDKLDQVWRLHDRVLDSAQENAA